MRNTPLARPARTLSLVVVMSLSAVFWAIAEAPAGSRICVGAIDKSACVPPA